MDIKKIIETAKGLVDIKIDVEEKVIAEMLFDKVVDKAMIKLVELIPTEVDNAFYESKREELKQLVVDLVTQELKKLEDKANEAI